MPVTVLISCGEPSGDLYAGALTRELRALQPDVRVLGLGGDRLQAAGGELVGDYRGLAVTGLSEAIRVLPRSLRMYRRLLRVAREVRPDVLVPIDFPDFNFRLAASVRKQGIPVVYYIPPQLWAWRSGRMKQLRALADRILVIFPFEPEIYREAGTPATFVGHPLLELARSSGDRDGFLARAGLDPSRPVVGLLPGSRPNEVAAILPTLVGACAIVSAGAPGTQYLLARAPNLSSSLFEPALPVQPSIRIVEGQADDVLAACDVVVTASGTATVQAAIHECPMVVVYKVSPLTYAIGRRFVHVDTFAMVNLVAGEKVAPELIQEAFTPAAVAAETLRLLTDKDARRRAVTALRGVKERLGGAGASRRAAEAVLEVALSRGVRL
ncbi:MAG TPA: lipid-A-disaccharide synthase [Vicinamibacterales bacterium]|nr:lipid-A-disaccharide synthase [Vicinamibacterales bacterium]